MKKCIHCGGKFYNTLKKRHFKVEFRKTCKICKKKITGERFRTFCCGKCRRKSHNIKSKIYQKQWGRNKRGRYEAGKIQCKICKKWYWQLGSHVVARHKMLARDYRIKFGLDYKTGKMTLAKKLRNLYKKQALENGTYKNLKNGKKHRFVKGDTRAGKYIRSKQTIERLKENFRRMNYNK